MFIKNDIGEFVNIAKITAVTFDKESAPYEMRVYTPATKYGVSFHYDTIEKLEKAANRLDKMMMPTRLRVIKFANWWLAAGEVESISVYGAGLHIRMEDGQSFDVIIREPKMAEKYVKEIEESLKSMWSMIDLDVDDED